MTTNHEQEQRRDELRRLLDGHGGDEARWPDGARRRLTALIAGLPDAGALIADARALDRALEVAGETSGRAANPMLVDRIMAAAMAAPIAAQPASGQVIQLGDRLVRATRTTVINGQFGVARGRMAAALMAASLLLGILLGGTVRLDPVLHEVADAVGLSADFESMHTALADDVGEEDQL